MKRSELKEGMKFGRLTLLDKVHQVGKIKKWLCRCDCEKEKYINIDSIIYGSSRSCGCLRKENTSRLNSRNLDEITTHIKNSVIIDKVTDCWNWNGYKTGGRYAGLHALSETKAHRISYRIFTGEIKKGNVICHTCDNPICVNPAHLFQATQKDNIADMDTKKRRNSPKGSRNANSKIFENQVMIIRKRFFNGESYKVLMSEYGYKSHSSFYNMIHNKTWKHVNEEEI